METCQVHKVTPVPFLLLRPEACLVVCRNAISIGAVFLWLDLSGCTIVLRAQQKREKEVYGIL